MKEKYKLAFMDMAERFAQTSECEKRKVGALIVKHGSIIAEGCNGTRAGYPTNVCEDENGNTLPQVRHAEIAALDKLRKTHNISYKASLFVTKVPCFDCSIEIVDAGIIEVFYREESRSGNNEGLQYLLDHGIIVEQL